MKKTNKYIILIITLCLISIAVIYIMVKGSDKMEPTLEDDTTEDVEEEVSFSVSSPAFKNGDSIPVKYTGRGEDVSIPLEFSNIDKSSKSIAIIMDDPDAPSGTFTHWLIWNIPSTITSIPENIPTDKVVSSLGDAIQGKNDFGRIGYKGPNPPSGTHTYRIKIYVLDSFLDLESNASKEDIENVMEGHILQSGLLEGKFSK